LQPVLTAAQIAGNDGVIHRTGELFAIGFGHVRQGAIQEQIALFVDQFGRHRCQTTAMEQVHEKRF
jgi:hypothetical protein